MHLGINHLRRSALASGSINIDILKSILLGNIQHLWVKNCGWKNGVSFYPDDSQTVILNCSFLPISASDDRFGAKNYISVKIKKENKSKGCVKYSDFLRFSQTIRHGYLDNML